MALLDIFKGKKGKFQKRQEKGGKRKIKMPVVLPKREAKEEVALKTPPAKKEAQLQKDARRKGEAKIAPRVLQFPRITEKATSMLDNNQYVFMVFPTAIKSEIKKSIEEVYGVDVLGVRVINAKGKSKRLGRSRGFQTGYKKAIVKLKEGQTIEVMPR